MENYWYIGDIHGEIRLLDRLLDHVLRQDPSHIVFVGDYIDRGAHSREVVDRILGLEVPVTCLLGNHEMMMLNSMYEPGYGYSPVELWYYNGGESTLESFGFSSFFGFRSEMETRYLDFFQKLRLSDIREPGGGIRVLATHAGISPSVPLKDHLQLNDFRELNQYILTHRLDPGESFIWVRESFFDASPQMWDGYLVVHGHTPVLKLKRYAEPGGVFHFVDHDICLRKEGPGGRTVAIDIDSGSVISGRLTGIGFYKEEKPGSGPAVRLRSMTVSREDIFPRDLGLITKQDPSDGDQ